MRFAVILTKVGIQIKESLVTGFRRYDGEKFPFALRRNCRTAVGMLDWVWRITHAARTMSNVPEDSRIRSSEQEVSTLSEFGTIGLHRVLLGSGTADPANLANRRKSDFSPQHAQRLDSQTHPVSNNAVEISSFLSGLG